MKIPQEIAMKVKTYREAMDIANKSYDDVYKWLCEKTDADGVYISDLLIVDEPTGQLQNVDEYCEQHEFGDSGDSFTGVYYHQIENSTQYLAYEYDC